MSERSIRNLHKRVEHKERAQPKAFAHLGILEKRGDWQKRATAHHNKKQYLRSLARKAALKNPNEYAFGMASTKTKGGIVVQSRGRDLALPAEQINAMKQQDRAHMAALCTANERQAARAAAVAASLRQPSLTATPGIVVTGAGAGTSAEAKLAALEAALARDALADARGSDPRSLLGAAFAGSQAVEEYNAQALEEARRKRVRAEKAAAKAEAKAAAKVEKAEDLAALVGALKDKQGTQAKGAIWRDGKVVGQKRKH